MGTEWMIKMKIAKKLLITYMILLLTVIAITGISFRLILQGYLINEAKTALRTEARAIADTLEKVPIYSGEPRLNLVAKRQMRIRGQFIDSKAVVLNNDGKVIYSNLGDKDKKVLQALSNGNLRKTGGYVWEREPVLTKAGEKKGQVILFSMVEDIKKLNLMIYRTQFLSLAIGGAVAVLLGMLLQRGLTRPIGLLQGYISSFSLKDSLPDLKLETGDEIEELAECFQEMIHKLKANDAQQKRFLQNSSHELKTPLMSIQGYAEAIRDGVVEGDELQDSLGVIIDESKRLKRVVDEMIYLTKLDNVEEAFSFESLAIGEIIAQSTRSVRGLADEKGLKLSSQGEDGCIGSYDAEKLSRAFINILSNGIRYAEKEINVNWEAVGEYIAVTIADDGPGFRDGEEKKVFERFYKGEKGGTGIGLAITEAIIAGHGGHIEAFNSKDHGAVFRIVLPGFMKTN